MYSMVRGTIRQLSFPAPAQPVLPGLTWGAFDELLTPAYWRGQAWQHEQLGTYQNLRLGRTLVEEVAACLLGGYGMPADLALAAYHRIRDANILGELPRPEDIEAILVQPMEINGRVRHYRFSRQKARYLSACLERLAGFSIPAEDIQFRDRLAELPGLGLKTASWIVRNMRHSSVVAVIDVHILRACRYMGLFPVEWSQQHNYRELEHRFVTFARAIDVSPATLDALMWDYMRRLSLSALNRPTVYQSGLFA
jgi:thermostable 8-oxoguanine DNA glycosylase